MLTVKLLLPKIFRLNKVNYLDQGFPKWAISKSWGRKLVLNSTKSAPRGRFVEEFGKR